MHACIYAYLHIHIHVRIQRCIRTHIHMCTCGCLCADHVCIHACVMSAHQHAFIIRSNRRAIMYTSHIRVHVNSYLYLLALVHSCAHVCEYIRACRHMSILSISYLWMRVYTHIYAHVYRESTPVHIHSRVGFEK